MKISLHNILSFLKERWPCYAVLLAGAFITLLIFFNHGTELLDSDMSAEMILGRLLKNEGGILADNWCYSTELRVIASQLVYKLFFYFSDNWLWVRILSTAFMLLTLAVSYCFFAERWNLGKSGILCGLVLLLPFSAEYARYVIWGAYYLPYLVFMFLALGLAVPFRSASLNKASLYLSAALAFLAGLSGIRAAVMIYIPLMLTAAVFVVSRLLTNEKWTAEPENTDKFGYFCKSAAFALSGGLIGAAVNSGFLSHAYRFSNYGCIKIIDVIPSLIFDFALRSFSSTLGYTGFALSLNADIFRGVFAAVCFVLLLAACLKFAELDFEGRFIVGFTVIGFLFNVLVCNLTCYLAVRYALPSLMMLVPTTAVVLNCLERGGLKTVKVLCAGLLCLCLSVQVIAFAVKPSLDYETGKAEKYSLAYRTGFSCKNQIVAPESFKEAIEFLLRNKYKKGFATFWHSDIITELSDGRIEMWTVSSDAVNIGNWTSMRKYAWLQDKRHLTKDPQGKVFLLLNRKELKYDRARLYTDEKHLIFKNKELAVYGYRSAEAMYNNLCGKRLNRIMRVKTSGGKKRRCGPGLIELKRGEKLRSPIVSVCRDRYELEIDCGSGAGASGKGLLIYGSKRLKKGFKLHNGLNRISLDLKGRLPEWRLELVNKSGTPLRIKSITLKKRNKNAKNS